MRDKAFDFDKKSLGLSKKVSNSTKGKEAPVEDIASFGAEDYMKMLLDMIAKVNKDVYPFLSYKMSTGDSLLEKMPYGWFGKCTYYNEDSYNKNQLVCARVYFRTFEEGNKFEVFCVNYSEQTEVEDKEYSGKNTVDNLNKAEEFVKKNLTSFGVLRNSLDESNLGLAKKARQQSQGKDAIDNVSPDIVFEDPEAERVCHSHGVKTYADASQVEDISHWFYINRRIKRFTELKYFTGLHVIGKEAFFMAENLEAVELPDSVETIQESAFSNCDKLVSIDLPESLVRIDKFAFYNSKGLKRVKFPEKMYILSFAAFDNCISLESVVLPRVYTIEKELFLGCKSLKSVTFNDSIETIESKAFKGCDSLKHVDLPDSIKGIDMYAFDNQVTFTISSACNLCQNIVEFFGRDRVTVKLHKFNESELGLAKKARQTYDSAEGKAIDMFGDTPLEFDEFKNLVIDMITSEKYIKGFKVSRKEFLSVKTLDHIPFYSKGIQSICFTQEKGDYSQFYTLDMSIATSEVKFTDSSSRGVTFENQYCLPMTIKTTHEIIKFMYETTPDWAKERYTTEEAVKIVAALNESSNLGLAKKTREKADREADVEDIATYDIDTFEKVIKDYIVNKNIFGIPDIEHVGTDYIESDSRFPSNIGIRMKFNNKRLFGRDHHQVNISIDTVSNEFSVYYSDLIYGRSMPQPLDYASWWWQPLNEKSIKNLISWIKYKAPGKKGPEEDDLLNKWKNSINENFSLGLAKKTREKAADKKTDIEELGHLDMETFKELLLKKIEPFKEEVSAKGGKVVVDVNYDNPGLGSAFNVVIMTILSNKVMSRHEIMFWKHEIWTCKVFNHLEGEDAEKSPSGNTNVMSGDFIGDHLNFLVDKIRETTKWISPETFKIDESSLGLAKKSRDKFNNNPISQVECLDPDKFAKMFIEEVKKIPEFKDWESSYREWSRWGNYFEQTHEIETFVVSLRSPDGVRSTKGNLIDRLVDLSIHRESLSFTLEIIDGRTYEGVHLAYDLDDFKKLTYDNLIKAVDLVKEYTLVDTINWNTTLGNGLFRENKIFEGKSSLGLAKKVANNAKDNSTIGSVDVEITKEEFADIVEKNINSASPIVEVTTRHNVEGGPRGDGIVMDFSYLSGHGEYDTWGRYRVYNDWWCMKLVGPFDVEYYYTSKLNKGLGMANINNHLNPKFQMWPLTQGEAIESSEWAIKWIKNRFNIDESSLGLAKKVSSSPKKDIEDVVDEMSPISQETFNEVVKKHIRSILSSIEKKGNYKTFEEYDVKYRKFGLFCKRLKFRINNTVNKLVFSCIDFYEFDDFFFVDVWSGQSGENYLINYGTLSELFDINEIDEILERLKKEYTVGNAMKAINFFKYNSSILLSELKDDFLDESVSSLGLAKKTREKVQSKSAEDVAVDIGTLDRERFIDMSTKELLNALEDNKLDDAKLSEIYTKEQEDGTLKIEINIQRGYSLNVLRIFVHDNWFSAEITGGSIGHNIMCNFKEDGPEFMEFSFKEKNITKMVKFFLKSSNLVKKPKRKKKVNESNLGLAKKTRDKAKSADVSDTAEEIGTLDRDQFIEILDNKVKESIVPEANANGYNPEVSIRKEKEFFYYIIYFKTYNNEPVTKLYGGTFKFRIMDNSFCLVYKDWRMNVKFMKDDSDEKFNMVVFDLNIKNIDKTIKFIKKESYAFNNSVNESSLGLAKKVSRQTENKGIGQVIDEMEEIDPIEFKDILKEKILTMEIPTHPDWRLSQELDLYEPVKSGEVGYSLRIYVDSVKDNIKGATFMCLVNVAGKGLIFWVNNANRNNVLIYSYFDYEDPNNIDCKDNQKFFKSSNSNLNNIIKFIEKFFTDIKGRDDKKEPEFWWPPRVDESSLGLAKKTREQAKEKNAEKILDSISVIGLEDYRKMLCGELSNIKIDNRPDLSIKIDLDNDDTVSFFVYNGFSKYPGGDTNFYVDEDTGEIVALTKVYETDPKSFVTLNTAVYTPEKDSTYSFYPLTYLHLKKSVEFVKRLLDSWSGSFPKNMHESRTALGLAKKMSDKNKDVSAEDVAEEMNMIPVEEFLDVLQEQMTKVVEKINLECLKISTETHRWMKVEIKNYPLEQPKDNGHIRILLHYDDVSNNVLNTVSNICVRQIMNVTLFESFSYELAKTCWNVASWSGAGRIVGIENSVYFDISDKDNFTSDTYKFTNNLSLTTIEKYVKWAERRLMEDIHFVSENLGKDKKKGEA